MRYIYISYIYIYILPHLFDIYLSFSLRPFVQRSTVCPAHLRRRSRGERMLRMLRTAWDNTAVAIRECQRIGSRDWGQWLVQHMVIPSGKLMEV
jgi:hypothetical protein